MKYTLPIKLCDTLILDSSELGTASPIHLPQQCFHVIHLLKSLLTVLVLTSLCEQIVHFPWKKKLLSEKPCVTMQSH